VLRLGESQWVLCDFGSTTTRAKVYESTLEISEEQDNIRRTTTPAYRAPEVRGGSAAGGAGGGRVLAVLAGLAAAGWAWLR
jgi:hypothetical protein